MAGKMRDQGQVVAVMRRLETALLDGTYPTGARLPAERLMATQYAVSRNTVREAVQRLGARGLLRSQPGAGVFVTDMLRSGIATPWGQLVADHPALRSDILEFRRVLEGATAYFAAQRADADDIARINGLMHALEQARENDDKVGEADIDSRLHQAVAQASHNTMFLHLHTSVIALLREHITINVAGLHAVDEDTSAQLLVQHRNVCNAIGARQPDQARTAMQSHIDFVSNRFAAEDSTR